MMLQCEAMPRRLPEGCVEDPDRHGNIRIYYRAKGRKKVRIRATPWTPEFMAFYEEAKSGIAPVARATIQLDTWRWLCVRYLAECSEYKWLDAKTQKRYKLILEATYDEPIAPGSPKLYRDFPISKFDVDAVEVLRDRKIDVPEAANNRLKAIRNVFKFGLKKKYTPSNPARDVSYFKTGSTGHHTWDVDEVAQYIRRHPVGTKAYLALALMLFTGQRPSDAIRFGRQHARAGKLTFTQHKNRNRKPKRLTLPLLPILERIIAASPCGDLTYLVNQYGCAFTDGGFNVRMRRWCDQAVLLNCTAHGLRKAGATLAAENGATAHQLMAIFGWDTLKQAELYTRAADQKRLAGAAMHMLEAPKTGDIPT